MIDAAKAVADATDKPPSWAIGLLGAIEGMKGQLGDVQQRLTQLEDIATRPVVTHQQLTPMLDQFIKREAPAAPKSVFLRCDACNNPFEEKTAPKFGDAKLCRDCARPGTKLRKCECGHRYMAGPGELKCATCRKCVLCGDKSSDLLCAECIKNDPGLECMMGCRRLAVGSTGKCRGCDASWNTRNAAQFVDTPQPGVEPRAVLEHQDAVLQAINVGDTATAQKLMQQPDLQPAMPRR